MAAEVGGSLDEAVAIVAGWPGVVERLLAAHVAGPDGRCAVCGGNGRPAPLWPCSVAELAGAARRLRG
ncbi:hypothetical protein ACQEVB_04750 [Pseudonocardia sp. CA-107938]|uniref:hypothetical protein n=1 Tax=Pseudonocardia sp. CA-107938 TaxID=3240021 RepID=UPI003D8A5F30